MANTLTGLLGYIHASVDVVSRELCGLIPAVTKNAKAEQVAKGQDITYPIVPAASTSDVEASNTIPDLSDSAYGTGTMTISKVKRHGFYWTGEDEAGLASGVKEAIENNKFAQGMRTLSNEIESDLAALYVNASRAYGTAGSTPFGTAGDFTDAANVVKILKDNGAPISDLQLVINTAAGVNIIGKQSRADIAGQTDTQRLGVLLDIAGCKIRESAQIKQHTKGTGADYLVNAAAGLAAGVVTIPADTGEGTIIAGDVVNIADDSPDYSYVVKTALADGSFVIQDPGLMAAAANDKAISLAANYAANMAFSKSAIHLLSRLPKRPSIGDQAIDVQVIQDPISGLMFEISMYKAYRAVYIEIATAWGAKATKPEHIALLLG